MELIKKKWDINDINELNNYLTKMDKYNDPLREKRIVNTNMEYLGVPIPKLKLLAKEIYKGNFISFLELNDYKYFENTIIQSELISKLKDYDLIKKYLTSYSNYLDNWSSVDSVKLRVKGIEDKVFNLAKEYIKSNKPFVRRLGIILLFNFTKNDEYLNDIFLIFDYLKKEEHYYVNMAASWLLCELVIKSRNEAINYIKNNDTNSFIINKMVSKCRDSYRVSLADKEYLLEFKKK